MKVGDLPYSLPLVTWPRFEDLRWILAEIREAAARQRAQLPARTRSR